MSKMERFKYPRTPYLLLTRTADPSDRIVDGKELLGKPLVFTIKMDGSNVTLCRDGCGARNGFNADHYSFDLLKAVQAQIGYLLPENVQIFGEWLFAKHSIHYKGSLALDDYLQIFGALDIQTKTFWSVGQVTKFCKEFQLKQVEARYWEVFHRIDDLYNMARMVFDEVVAEGHEGIVIRNTREFPYDSFSDNVCKMVRENHVQTDEHWRHSKLIENEVKIYQ